ncbi:MAG: 16S rRNA (cytosine(967)-C(5))-methyltransferase RsmB, partial [Acidobacteria bacterium]|nr:16S rRNA (cytosine(967)-C(5))-methyltransferase RsmB [Acidobacteriota bacterium]
MPTPARQAAFDILLRVHTRSSYAAELLHSERTQGLPSSDLALCTELVLGTLRWQATLDFIAQQFVQTSWTSLDPEVQVALRMGIYQLRYLTRMPARAAVHETVELVKRARKGSAAGLVNAVLRKAAGADLESLRPPDMPPWEWWGIEYSHPAWLLECWGRQYGQQTALELARANNQSAPTFLRLNLSDGSLQEAEEALRREGVETRPGRFLKSCRAVEAGNVAHTELYRRGEVLIQDEASQMVPYLLAVQKGQRVLDLCAAPGNKTAQLAQWVGNSGRVVACDLHADRLKQLLSHHRFANIIPVVLDGRRTLPFSALFDRILVDAPCSGTGTLRRNPEIKWRLSPGDLAALAEKQGQLLESAATVLSVSGRLVYSTCSLESEENQAVIERFLRRHPEFRFLPLREEAARLEPDFQPPALAILQQEFLQTWPPRDGTDGFFAAILVKTQETRVAH